MVDATLFNWTLSHLLTIMVILTRIVPLVIFMPIIGSRAVSSQSKVLFSAATALMLMNVVPVSPADLPVSPLGYGLFIGSEVIFGGTLALFARLVFAAVQIAGQTVGVQMGMGMAGVMDPQFGTQVSIIGQFWNLIATLLFLAMNGHHLFFSTLTESFTWVPPGTLNITEATYAGMLEGTNHMFILAVKIMAPASAALFFAHVAMGIIAKTVPQIPILIVGMPMNIAIGFIFVGLSLGYFIPLMGKSFETLGRILPKLAMGLGV